MLLVKKKQTLKSEKEGNNVQSSDLQFIFHVLHFKLLLHMV